MRKINIINKKILYLFIIILVAAAFFINNSSKRLVSETEISDRAKEFLKSQNYSFEEVSSVETKSNQFISTNCFEIKMPFAVRSLKTESTSSKCIIGATLNEPHALITISVENLPDLISLEEYSGVKMRLKNDDVYYQENFGEIDLPNIKVFSTQNELTYFSLKNSNLMIVSLHDLIRSNDEIHDLLEQIVASIVMK